MPVGLKRYQQTGDMHFVTFSCYRRLPFLISPQAKQVFEEALETLRRRHEFYVAGYVLMPEHIHMLLTEPQNLPLSSMLRVLKGEISKRLKGTRDQFWQRRYHDFNVYSEQKRVEKLRYMHRNPVARGLVERPQDYPWSSLNHWLTGKIGRVEIESPWTARRRESAAIPLIAKAR
jgi:putative transposase